MHAHQQQKPQKRQNRPLKQRQSSHAKSLSGTGGRTAPTPKKAHSKSKPATKSRPSSSTPQFSKSRVDQTLSVLEGLYGWSRAGADTFNQVVRRPTDEAIELIVQNDWRAIEAVVGCVAPHERSALIRAAISQKQHEIREEDAQKRDNDRGRKQQRVDKPPIRRRHVKSKV
jgi:hypothetical protein